MILSGQAAHLSAATVSPEPFHKLVDEMRPQSHKRRLHVYGHFIMTGNFEAKTRLTTDTFHMDSDIVEKKLALIEGGPNWDPMHSCSRLNLNIEHGVESAPTHSLIGSGIPLGDKRAIKSVTLGDSSISLDIMIYRGEREKRRPLLILNAIEFPMPPSERFCAHMWDAGYQVVFARRPGFGGSTDLPKPLMNRSSIENGTTVVTEAALLAQLIKELELEKSVLLSLGSANPTAFRLASLSPNVVLSMFVNPAFNEEIYDDFEPDWFSKMLRQIMDSESGLRVTVQGLKAVLKTRPIWFFKQLAQSSAADTLYIRENKTDFAQASELLLRLEPEQVLYQIMQSLQRDDFLKDRSFAGLHSVVLTGAETVAPWQARLCKEADRLAIPVETTCSGNFFVPYTEPLQFLEILRRHDRVSAPI